MFSQQACGGGKAVLVLRFGCFRQNLPASAAACTCPSGLGCADGFVFCFFLFLIGTQDSPDEGLSKKIMSYYTCTDEDERT